MTHSNISNKNTVFLILRNDLYKRAIALLVKENGILKYEHGYMISNDIIRSSALRNWMLIDFEPPRQHLIIAKDKT